ncbi:g10854 [Coccomyxa viridis]|uniref:G10854 protein n=1 Tax=Coccomyxa viridis TaxID=1274662 RepID=A0ABP1G6D4_9CHLO
MKQVDQVDVAIAGGGPGGLAAAAAIVRALPDCRVKVFESAPSYTPQGAGVLINLNGQNALEAIDPELFQRMKAQSVSVIGSVSLNKDGSKEDFRDMRASFTDGGSFQERYGKSMFFLGWHEIRQTLYESLPEGVVEFGKKFDRYSDEGDAGVHVHFKDGDEVQAKVLIGADGYFSGVRAQMLDDGPPEFTGNVMWRARFPLRSGFTTDRTRWWREAEGFQGRFAVIFPIDRENVTFVASAPIAELHKQGLPFNPDEPRSVQADLANADNLQRCMTVFHDFDKRLLTVLRETDPSTVTEHGLYERPVAKMPDEGWCRGNVSVIGDAAHAGLPNGQGLNLAIEDGAVLGWHFREHGVSAEALRGFNAERGPRVKEVYTKGLDAHRGAEKERIIFETAFRSVQPGRPDPTADASSARPDRATLHVPARALAARAHAAHAQPDFLTN